MSILSHENTEHDPRHDSNQGCGAGTQISRSDPSFGLRFQAYKNVGSGSNLWQFLAPAPERFFPLKTKSFFSFQTSDSFLLRFYVYNWPAPQNTSISVERELKCQVSTPPLK